MHVAGMTDPNRDTVSVADRALDIQTFKALAVVVDAALDHAKVTRLVGDDPINGTARALVSSERGGFLGRGDDIREALLHVTGQSGVEHFWPVTELTEQARRGEFAVRDW